MTPALPPESVVASIPELAAEFATRIESWAAEAIAERGKFSLALPGGSVARAFLPRLAVANVAWESVHLCWVDERAVAVTAESSNAGLARRVTEGTAIRRAKWHMVAASPAVLDAAAVAYGRLLEKIAGQPPVLDVVLLGVGEDGHVASIFPGAERTDLAAPAGAVDNAPKPPAHRVTMSVSTICSARHVVVAAFGTSKHPAIAHALLNPQSISPLARVLRGATAARSLLMLLDKEAAGG